MSADTRGRAANADETAPSLEGTEFSKYLWENLANVLMSMTSIYEQRGARKPASRIIINARIRRRIMSLRAALPQPTTAGAPVTVSELQRITYTAAAAILNPIVVDVDVKRLASRVKNRLDLESKEEDEELAKFFRCKLSLENRRIEIPTVFVDHWDNIIAWHLPDIISPARVEEVNIATEQISNLMSDSQSKAQAKAQWSKTKKINWRSDPAYFRAPEVPRFVPGSINLSPGWFAQGHERLSDPIIPSTMFREESALLWLKRMQPSNVLFNAILALTHRPLYLAGHEAISKVKQPEDLGIKIDTHEHVDSWNSAFTGISVIANRVTPRHRDSGGSFPWYDLLFSAGAHRGAYLGLDDIGAELSYNPGTAVAVCGRVFSHSLPEWLDGERICIASFMRNMVHDRLKVYHPEWSTKAQYLHYMNTNFVRKQGWGKKRSSTDHQKRNVRRKRS